MNLVRWITLRLRSVLQRDKLEDDMQVEMHDHLDRATERLVGRGLTPAEARTAARREFGNVTVIEDDAREARGGRWVEGLLADVRFALRFFKRQKMTTATLVAVLALGIGANTVIFSALQAFTMRPVPAVPEDDSHARIYGVEQTTRGARWRLREFSYPELQELANRKETFAAVAGWNEHDVVLNASDTSEARGLNAQFVTPNFFRALGVTLAAGPGFTAGDMATPDLSVIISAPAARTLFGAPEHALGRAVIVNDIAVRIVGVAPSGFRGAIRTEPRPHLWLPLSARADIARRSPRWLEAPSLLAFARLAPGVSREQATAIARDVAVRTLPDSSAQAGTTRSTEVLALRSPPPAYASEDQSRALMGALVGVVGLLVLLVACTNVSSLLVASAVARRHEIAVRLSMGASRARLLRQMLTESALLSVVGGGLGLLLYWWIMSMPDMRGGEAEFGVNMTPDFGTLLFTTAFSLGTGLLFGLSPALHATRGDVAKALRDSGTGATHRSRLQSGFVVAQLVCSQPLLLMLGIMMLGVVNEGSTNPTTDGDRVILAHFRPLTSTGGPGQRQQAVEALALRIERHANVERVVPDAATFAVANVVATDTAARPKRLHIDGAAPGYFAMHGMPILMGRDVSLADTAGPEHNLVIGSDVARELYGDANPIGQRLASVSWPYGPKDSAALRVVGVFDASGTTAKLDGPHVYTANGKRWSREVLLIRTRGLAEPTIPELRALFRADAPGLPLSRIQTLAYIEKAERDGRLYAASGIGAAGFVALLLAMLGLYGVVALSVTQRQREIGIRLAMGARPTRVALMFLGSGVRLTAVGVLVGLPIGIGGIAVLVAGKTLPPSIVSVWSLSIAGAVAGVMLLVAAVAAWGPARKAAAVDPALTLRAE